MKGRLLQDEITASQVIQYTLGGWYLPNDVTPEEGSTPLSEIPLWPNDPEFVYVEVLDMEDFILSLLG